MTRRNLHHHGENPLKGIKESNQEDSGEKKRWGSFSKKEKHFLWVVMIGTEKGGDHIFVQRKSFLRVLLVGSWQGFQEPSKTPSKGASTPCSPFFYLGRFFSSKYSGLEIGKFRKVHVSWAQNLSAWRTSLLLEVSCNTTVVFLFLSSLKKLEIGAKMASSPLFRLKIGAIIGHPGDGKPKTQFPYCIDILLRRDQALPAALTKRLTGGKLMYLTANFIQFWVQFERKKMFYSNFNGTDTFELNCNFPPLTPDPSVAILIQVYHLSVTTWYHSTLPLSSSHFYCWV